MKILFRIVTIILSVGVILAAFFVPILNGTVSLIGMSLSEDFSIYDIIKLAVPTDGDSQAAFNIAEFWQTLKASVDVLEPIIAPAICFLAFFILTLLVALVLVIINLIKPMKKTTTVLGLSGIASIIAMFISLNVLENPLVAGTVNIFDIFDLSFLISLATSFVEINALALTSGAYLMLFAFAIIFIWGLSYIVIDLGEPKERKRKLK